MMRAHNGRIDHLQCRIGESATCECLQDQIPNATVGPSAELSKYRIPFAKLLRQIAPRRASPHQPQYRVQHETMVARRTPSVTEQKRFEVRPLIVVHQSANQGCPPQRTALNQLSILPSTDFVHET
jgi:hypothetical protein